MTTNSPRSRGDVAARSAAVAATSPRRLLIKLRRRLRQLRPYLIGLETRWRPGGDSSLRCMVAETSPRRGKFKHVRFFFETFSSLHQVAGTSPHRHRNVAATSHQSPWSPAGLGDVAETSPRPAGDWKKSPKIQTCLNFPRLPGDPASLQETSRRRLRNQRRLESPPSLQANEIGPIVQQ